MRTAIVDYNGVNGLLKCTPHVDRHRIEITVLRTLWQNISHIEPFRAQEILDTFQTNDGYHCLVLETIRGYSLREYISMIPEYYKDVAISKFATTLSYGIHLVYKNGFTHGSINPDSIYCQPNERDGTVELVLTGFEGSQPLAALPQPSIVKPIGYTPPEDYVKSKVDQRLRDTWMFGATLYFMTNGHPPYGFAYSENHKAMLPVSAEELQQTMEQVAKTGNNTYPPLKTKNAALAQEIERLLEPKPEHRYYVDSIAFLGSFDDFGYITMGSYLWELWDYLKSKLPIIGKPSWLVEPPLHSHVEDTSTRYKNP
ncbi:kinase-like domain-containing protein [Thamnocephalis sphaerospora]|uniref:Kinase-like domain-containing protein n=1 Tax=Thamnocephalis sphaerospora TaxID=78915 RepID=A0A4P9XLE1_9FUNG|nr:kinase-like domain-containing protein [Thamnocephalis sphaerospora]RKP06616.1 kinase-like domain-containing protein [Thamnocephalis sphaerospora]|eukprot:RKP06226.1 kinase-like domain-containing protein [Thamnocephalis sphaerospora]